MQLLSVHLEEFHSWRASKVQAGGTHRQCKTSRFGGDHGGFLAADSGSGARIPYTRSGKYSRQSFTQTRTLNSNGKSAKILWLHCTLPMGSLVCDLKLAGAEFSSDLRSK
ncbi:hypothetical protein CEXT_297371 [Caerostris extrusa]|uniref:Uncharacterized protein n=1 Tax=Caerostris extrusa TaxID=172846 RepID=A0AAV4MGW8_CAEEX|nr:hypothetical protein CEXT_297371 [Caerostris extrusa]